MCLCTGALNLLQLVTGAPQYDREGNVTIKCLQSVTRYDILLQQGDYNMLQVLTDPTFTFALGVLYTGAGIAGLRHVPNDKPGVKGVTECVRE